MEHMKGLVDSTLREGSQAVGVAFSLARKVALARLLADIGIEEVEAGIAIPRDRELPELVHRCRDEAGVRRLALWCRCREEDIDCALALAPDVLSLSIPVSDLHMAVRLGRGRRAVLALAAEGMRRARPGVSCLSLGLEDATRADRAFLGEMVQSACSLGVDRVRIADTVGVATPAAIASLVRDLRRAFPAMEIGVHMHNDFGMASANAVAALEAGAHWADVTVLGLGERAGNSRLEEVAGHLALRCGRPYGVRLFRELAESVAAWAGRRVEPHHPVVGTGIFACESGLHLAGLARDPHTYEPYEPALVGASRRLLCGSKVGRRGLAERLRGLGLQWREDGTGELLDSFRERCRLLGRPLHDREVLQLLAEQSS
jgi:homocitrate synthase NifV